MRKTLPTMIPAPAMLLLDFIGGIEAPEGYDTIFGNRQDRLPVPLTKMTYGDVVDAQANWGNKSWVKKHWGYRTASSAAGRMQFMRATLIGIAQEIPSLRGDMLFDKVLQDKLGYYLLQRRGYEDFIAGKLSVVAFGKALAQEWASFPVLVPCTGAHQLLNRGDTYYAGDGLNKALVAPERVEAMLRKVLAAARQQAIPEGQPAPSAPAAKRKLWDVLAELVAKIFGSRE